jgi:Flp pilus assembly protein TadD
VEQAIAIFQHNVERHPDSWNCRDSLGEAYAAGGDTHQAVENYRKALSMAPEAQKSRIEGILKGLEGR